MKRPRAKRRRQVIERRMSHLSDRIAKTHNEYDSAEFSALRWALKQVDEAEQLRTDIAILEAKLRGILSSRADDPHDVREILSSDHTTKI